VPGGQIFVRRPVAGQAGWWASDEAEGNHLGDAFLYGGHQGDKVFISAARYLLGSLPRGAKLHEARIELSGLNADRFDPGAGGLWSVQLVADDEIGPITETGFQRLLQARDVVTLFPELLPSDLAVGKTNTAKLEGAGLEWLEKQVNDGAKAVIARFTGPAGGADNLFAWDAGTGAGSLGSAPLLVIHAGAPPATPPPLPTEAVVVATETATPSNILTVDARLATATADAARGTPTPQLVRFVTPTPSPANLATIQAVAFNLDLAPVVVPTWTPGNEATATIVALIATVEARLTGTATSTPQGAVTPVLLTPTPVPTNALTAVALLRQATAQVAASGTSTPWPYNALVATPTPATPTPLPPPLATAIAWLEGKRDEKEVPPVGSTAEPGATPEATPSVIPSPEAPTAAVAPTPRPANPQCTDPRARVTVPGAGAAIRGLLEVRGSAGGPGFAAYRLEAADGADAQTNFNPIATGSAPVTNGLLGSLNTAPLRPGAYTLRLQSLFADGAVAECRVNIRILP
jgi:hypothetical protein